MIERPYVTLQEAATILRCSPDALRMRIARGHVRAYRLSRRIVYLRRDELMDYVEKGSLPPPPPRAEGAAGA